VTRINEIEWEAPLLEPRPSPEFEKRFRRQTGRPGAIMRYWVGSEWMSDTVLRLSTQLSTYVAIDPELADRVGLVVSQENSCRFCFGAQRVLMRGLGIPEARIAELEQQQRLGEISTRDHAALNYARKLSRARPGPSATELTALRDAGLDALQIAELSGQVALHMFFNRISTFIALPPRPMERIPDAWWMRLLQPVLKPYFVRMRHHESRAGFDPEHIAGPFGFVLAGLEGLPMARELRSVLDGAFASPTLSPRAAALAFAVVARALGSESAEAEARRLLVEGGTPDGEIDAVLTHLAADGLSQAEQASVAFARDSVWYVPAPIQRRLRALKPQLSDGQFVELVGVVSLANSICRLAELPGGA
jgi:alkylhydroperoxidase family enzyme